MGTIQSYSLEPPTSIRGAFTYTRCFRVDPARALPASSCMGGRSLPSATLGSASATPENAR